MVTYWSFYFVPAVRQLEYIINGFSSSTRCFCSENVCKPGAGPKGAKISIAIVKEMMTVQEHKNGDKPKYVSFCFYVILCAAYSLFIRSLNIVHFVFLIVSGLLIENILVNKIKHLVVIYFFTLLCKSMEYFYLDFQCKNIPYCCTAVYKKPLYMTCACC